MAFLRLVRALMLLVLENLDLSELRVGKGASRVYLDRSHGVLYGAFVLPFVKSHKSENALTRLPSLLESSGVAINEAGFYQQGQLLTRDVRVPSHMVLVLHAIDGAMAESCFDFITAETV
jgi:hypothetical protein